MCEFDIQKHDAQNSPIHFTANELIKIWDYEIEHFVGNNSHHTNVAVETLNYTESDTTTQGGKLDSMRIDKH